MLNMRAYITGYMDKTAEGESWVGDPKKRGTLLKPQPKALTREEAKKEFLFGNNPLATMGARKKKRVLPKGSKSETRNLDGHQFEELTSIGDKRGKGDAPKRP